MQSESFFRHARNHWFVYLALLCLGAAAGLTLFQLTEPRDPTPRLLLISDGTEAPALAYDAQVTYAAADADPEQRQAYVLTTGSGGFSLFCAPESLLKELYESQLIQPVAMPNALPADDGTPIAVPIGAGYALCLAHHAQPGAEEALRQLTEIAGN